MTMIAEIGSERVPKGFKGSEMVQGFNRFKGFRGVRREGVQRGFGDRTCIT
jgi:hypothetical protein